MIGRLGHTVCSNKFKFIIAPLIVGVATFGLIFQNVYFFTTLQKQNEILLRTISILLYTMCFISFYKSIITSNAPPSNLAKPRLKKMLRNNHQFYNEVNQCHKENNKYKPARTSHCSVCKCVVRMDHHCPYINNCVGLKNFKSFILFTGYGGLFALMFLISSVKYYFDLKSQKISPLSQAQITIWLFLTFIAFFLALSMCGLALSNIYMASKNVTQLQMLKGVLRLNDKHGLHPNPYDLGALTNLNTIFDSDKWSFWFPTQIITDNDGTQFKKIPEITYDDIKKLPAHIQENIKTTVQKSIPKTIEQLREKQITNYANTIFFYLGKQYRLNEEVKEQFDFVNRNQAQNFEEKQAAYEQNLIRQAENDLQQIDVEQEQVQKTDQQEEEYKKAITDIYGQESIQNPTNEQEVISDSKYNQNDQSLLLQLDQGQPSGQNQLQSSNQNQII